MSHKAGDNVRAISDLEIDMGEGKKPVTIPMGAAVLVVTSPAGTGTNVETGQEHDYITIEYDGVVVPEKVLSEWFMKPAS